MNDQEPSAAMTSPSPEAAHSLFRGLLWHFRKPFAAGIASLAVTDAMDILPPLLIKAAIDGLEQGTQRSFLYGIGAIYLVSALIQGFFRYQWRTFFIGTSHQVVWHLRTKLYEHMQTLSFGYFNKTRTGELMSRLTNDLDEVRSMFGIGMLLFMDALFYFLSVPLIMIWLSPKLALTILLPLPIIPVFVFFMGRLIHQRSKRQQERQADLSAKVQENISGIRIVKAFAREDAETAAFERVSRSYVEGALALARVEAGFHPALELAMGIGIFFLLLFGSRSVLDGTVSIGSFIAFQAYLLKMVWPMTALGWTINLHQRGLASLGRCAELLAERPEIEPAPTDHPLPTNGLRGAIDVANLSFSYPGCADQALNGISFALPAGKTLGIVGPVGGGKTTLVHLLLRLYEPPPDTVRFDGRDVREYPVHWLREQIGYVPQDTFLFSESIAENLAFGLKEAGDIDRIRRCLKLAQVDTDVDALPDREQALLGERGVNLSGGQKQRLTLARALTRDPVFLILDDAISAVDTDTESRILEQLRTVTATRTAIIVSHRLASVQNADLIIHLAGGRITERGTHHELLARNGAYARLWEKQQLHSKLDKAEPSGLNSPSRAPDEALS